MSELLLIISDTLNSLSIHTPVFAALRVYALLDGKYVMACIIFLLNLVPFGTNMVSIYLRDSQMHMVTQVLFYG